MYAYILKQKVVKEPPLHKKARKEHYASQIDGTKVLLVILVEQGERYWVQVLFMFLV